MEKKIILFFFMFRIFCCILFLYQAAMCLDEFVNQKPGSNPKYDKQEKHPIPLFCFSTSKFDFQELNTIANITFTEYRWGKWKTDQFQEEELFNVVSPKLSSLIKKIEIYRNTDQISDSYEKINIEIPEEENNLEEVSRFEPYVIKKKHPWQNFT